MDYRPSPVITDVILLNKPVLLLMIRAPMRPVNGHRHLKSYSALNRIHRSKVTDAHT